VNDKPKTLLPPIPAKRYFTIGEVSDLCMVKPHVLRYWEQEFTQLRPMKRRGNRRYYQHHEVLLVRRIRDLLYEQGFTISGARNQLGDRLADLDSDLATGSSMQTSVTEREPVRSGSMMAGSSSETLSMNEDAIDTQEELIIDSMPIDVPKARQYLTEALRFLS
jgi:DNA-binding transcriptional MerR regulator